MMDAVIANNWWRGTSAQRECRVYVAQFEGLLSVGHLEGQFRRDTGTKKTNVGSEKAEGTPLSLMMLGHKMYTVTDHRPPLPPLLVMEFTELERDSVQMVDAADLVDAMSYRIWIRIRRRVRRRIGRQ